MLRLWQRFQLERDILSHTRQRIENFLVKLNPLLLPPLPVLSSGDNG